MASDLPSPLYLITSWFLSQPNGRYHLSHTALPLAWGHGCAVKTMVFESAEQIDVGAGLPVPLG